jgi:3-hydroxy-D-aspartate aldolase
MEMITLDKDLIGKKNSRHQITTPALLIDLDALEENILTMALFSRHHKAKLRPHCKSHKSSYIAGLQKEAGAIGISCATIGEAEEMVHAGISGVLITSPVVHPRKISSLIEMNQKAHDLLVVVDNVDNVHALAKANDKHDKPLQVLIDFDVGQKRTGARTFESAVSLAEAISKHRSLLYKGIQAYAGHLQHVEDYNERKGLVQAQNTRIKELCKHLETISMPPEIITGGGTGTFDIDFKEGVYTELQVGSYLFMDVEYAKVSLQREAACPFKPSLFVLTTVISVNDGAYITDGGWKAFATDGPEPQVFSGASPKTTYQFMGDEHGKLTPPAGFDFLLGEMVECLTPHCDPTVNLYDVYYCVRGDTVVDIWRINARGLH